MQQPVVLIGGSGFVGQAVTRALLAEGYPVTIVSRRPKAPSNLPTGATWHSLQAYSPSQWEALFGQLGGQSAVVNLVGILHGNQGTPYGQDFLEAHVELPRQIMAAMARHGHSRFIHISALGADSRGPSMYLRSKGDAEALIKKSPLPWTLLRPSVIFGREDNFINLFARLSRFLRIFPLAGANTLMQPVAVEDVAAAVVKCLSLPQTIHQAYDLAGPGVYPLAQLVRFSASSRGRKLWVVPLPLAVGKLQALLMEKMPGTPLMSRDNVDSLSLNSILPAGTENPLSTVFGITPTPLESLL
jgi:NADH dehydrogenase